MLAATKSKFRDVDFQTVDLTEPGGPGHETAEKYGISGIPHVVFLDGSGNVLFNSVPSQSAEGFEEEIKQFH